MEEIMQQFFMIGMLAATLVFSTAACGSKTNSVEPAQTAAQTSEQEVETVTGTTKIQDVINLT